MLINRVISPNPSPLNSCMISNFYKKTPQERRQILIDNQTVLSDEELHILAGKLNDETFLLDKMSENVIGACRLPLGILTGILVNGTEHSVAMATEEPSVIAAVNRASKLINAAGGIITQVQPPEMIAQISLTVPLQNIHAFQDEILKSEKQWLELANSCDPVLISNGGGACQINTQIFNTNAESEWNEVFITIDLHVRTADAMGANILNTMAEKLMQEIISRYQHEYQCKPVMAILSNRACHRMVTARCSISNDILSDFYPSEESLGIKLHRASVFAELSPERAITHNKGILNGIIAASIPLGQDTRAIEAAAYDYACIHGSHKPLSRWKYQNDTLIGELTMPLVVGYVGGFRTNPAFDAAFRFARIDSYTKLCSLLSSIGLAQNMAALWALSTEGIQAGHMKLHQRKHIDSEIP